MTTIGPWQLELTLACETPGVTVRGAYESVSGLFRVTLTNTGAEAVRPIEVTATATLDVSTASGSLWVHGRHMNIDAFVREFGTPQPEGYSGHALAEVESGWRYTSAEVAVFALPARQTPALLIGALRMDRFTLHIAVDVTSEEDTVTRLELRFGVDGLVLEPGESVELQPVVFAEGRDQLPLIEQYAERAAAEMSARVPVKPLSGWSSWQQFGGDVREQDVLANVAAVKELGLPLDYIQVDDGYQAATGDWLTASARFPSGMAALAAQISEAGLRPGLWLAPFLAHESSAILRERPEIWLRTTAGEVCYVETWLGRCAVLDCTHLAAEAWLREVVRTVARVWGYTFLKLDGVSYGNQPASTVAYHAAGTTGIANVRRGLEIIRDEAGNRVYLLGCMAPFGASIGLVDGMRVGPDVKNAWEDGAAPSVRHAMRMTLQRNWMHGRWWANDPDCLVLGGEADRLNEAETRFLATAAVLAGGAIGSGDQLAALPPERLAMLRRMLPGTGIAAEPSDPDEGPVPSSWRTELGDGRALVGLLNWTDEPKWVVTGEQLEPGEIAFDAWRGKRLGMGDVLLRPHEGALWQVLAPGRARGPKGPRVVGDSGSIVYAGLFQRLVSGRLQVRNDGAHQRTVAIEARGQVLDMELAPGEMRWFD